MHEQTRAHGRVGMGCLEIDNPSKGTRVSRRIVETSVYFFTATDNPLACLPAMPSMYECRLYFAAPRGHGSYALTFSLS